jgi:hypothetical protein
LAGKREEPLTTPGNEEYYIFMAKGAITGEQTNAGPGGPGKENKPADAPAKADKDDPCRCKEASTMTPRELLKLMIGDLTFWKKVNKK